MKDVTIQEVVTFIKQTREEAIALAYDMGGGEVHALHFMMTNLMPSAKPIGYLVLPLSKD
jgi:hypothetical protein